MSAAYTGHNDYHRRLTKRDLAEFGKEHAPIFVAPPANKCDWCPAETVLRYYVSGRGWCCERCRDLPTISTLRASQCHRGCYYVPLGLFDVGACLDTKTSADVKPPPAAVQDGRSDALTAAEALCRKVSQNVQHFDAMKEAQCRWTAARKASEARRGDVTPRRYQKPIIKAAA
jgi:hypothetical protein